MRHHGLRRSLRYDDKLPGMGDEFWAAVKERAETRMQAIDESPSGWRDLVNEYGLEPVVELAKYGYSLTAARDALRRNRQTGA